MHRPVKLNKDPINKTCIQSNQHKERTYGLRKSICWVFIWPKVKIQKLNKANIKIQFKCSNARNRYFSESKWPNIQVNLQYYYPRMKCRSILQWILSYSGYNRYYTKKRNKYYQGHIRRSPFLLNRKCASVHDQKEDEGLWQRLKADVPGVLFWTNKKEMNPLIHVLHGIILNSQVMEPA